MKKQAMTSLLFVTLTIWCGLVLYLWFKAEPAWGGIKYVQMLCGKADAILNRLGIGGIDLVW